MKNYTGFFIILFLLCLMLIVSTVQFNSFEKQLLDKAYKLSEDSGENRNELYNDLKNSFIRCEKRMMMLVNHTLYKDTAKCVLKLGRDIEFGNELNIKTDMDELIFYLEEMINGEKSGLDNIF